MTFDRDGLIPCVVQEWRTGAVLMVAWMNRASIELTLSTGETCFYSRSRRELWQKGETSGNVQRVKEIRYDCDSDTLLALVEAAGPACHTGRDTCFYRSLDSNGTAPFEALPTLARTLADRRTKMPAGSYTTELLTAGAERIGEKVQEEAAEVVEAALGESDRRVAEEAADVLYHLAVLLESRRVSLVDAFAVLVERMNA